MRVKSTTRPRARTHGSSQNEGKRLLLYLKYLLVTCIVSSARESNRSADRKLIFVTIDTEFCMSLTRNVRVQVICQRTVPFLRSLSSRFRRKMAASTHIEESLAVNKTAHAFNKDNLSSLLSQRFFYAPSFDIYGGGSDIYRRLASDLLKLPRCCRALRLRAARLCTASQHHR